MKAVVEHDFITNSFRVWFHQPGPRGTRLLLRFLEPPGQFMWEETDEAADKPAPSLVLSRDALEALIAEASDVLPPGAATDRHLLDAIAVRDRLLALVEKDDA